MCYLYGCSEWREWDTSGSVAAAAANINFSCRGWAQDIIYTTNIVFLFLFEVVSAIFDVLYLLLHSCAMCICVNLAPMALINRNYIASPCFQTALRTRIWIMHVAPSWLEQKSAACARECMGHFRDLFGQECDKIRLIRCHFIRDQHIPHIALNHKLV